MENPDSTKSPHRRGPSHHLGDGAAHPRARSRGRLRALSRGAMGRSTG